MVFHKFNRAPGLTTKDTVYLLTLYNIHVNFSMLSLWSYMFKVFHKWSPQTIFLFIAISQNCCQKIFQFFSEWKDSNDGRIKTFRKWPANHVAHLIILFWRIFVKKLRPWSSVAEPSFRYDIWYIRMMNFCGNLCSTNCAVCYYYFILWNYRFRIDLKSVSTRKIRAGESQRRKKKEIRGRTVNFHNDILLLYCFH